MRRTFILLTIVVLVFSILATGCANKPAGGDVQKNDEQENVYKGEKKDKGAEQQLTELKFTVFHPVFSSTAQGTQVQDKWLEMMESYMGLKLDITWEELPFGDYGQRLQVYLASGEYADVFEIHGGGAFDNINQLGEDGAVVNLLDYEGNIPHYQRYLQEGNNKEKVSAPDGGIYTFADGAISTHCGTQNVFSIRTDVFKENNITPPKTLDELYNVAKQLKILYPESYPITSFWDIVQVFMFINHVNKDIYYSGEKYVFGPVDEEEAFKETLMYMNKLFDEKLLDPEFFTQTTDQSMEKMLTGKAFIVPNFSGSRIMQYMNTNKEHPEVEWGIIEYPSNDKGVKPWKIGFTLPGRQLGLGYNIVINSNAQHPDLLVKLVDYQYSDEMFELANWGIEGVTFEKTGEGIRDYTSAIKSAEVAQLELAKYGVNQSMSCRSGIQFMPQDRDAALKLLEPIPAYGNGQYFEENFWKFYSDFGGLESIYPGQLAPVVKLTSEEKDLVTNTMTPINTYISESITKFITGENKFTDWDDFISGIKKMGDYQAIVDLYNSKIK